MVFPGLLWSRESTRSANEERESGLKTTRVTKQIPFKTCANTNNWKTLLVRSLSFSSPEAALLLVSTKNRDLWPSPTPEVRDSRTSRHSAHVQSQVWQMWLVLVSIYCVYKALQKRNAVGLGQRSWFLVLTKRSAASGDENGSLWIAFLPDFLRRLWIKMSLFLSRFTKGYWEVVTRRRQDDFYFLTKLYTLPFEFGLKRSVFHAVLGL